MLRKYTNSKISIFEINLLKGFEDYCFVIQTETVGDKLLIEWCKNSEILDLQPFLMVTPQGTKTASFDNSKYDEYISVVINNDPFCKYSGKTLGDIFTAQDKKWIDKAIQEMRNNYIKDRVIYLRDYYISQGAEWL